MATCLIEQRHARVLPWDLFRVLQSRAATAFFLDSHHYNPPNQAFSYLGINPELTLTLSRTGLKITSGRKTKIYPAPQWVKIFKQLLRKHQSSASSKYPFLTGGWIGYLGYELVSSFEKIRFRASKQTVMPSLFFGLYRNLAVYDHKQGIYYLTAWAGSKKKAEKSLRIFSELLERAEKEASSARRGGENFSFRNFKPDLNRKQFIRMVRAAQQYIEAGDIYQANLSQRFSFQFKGSPLRLYDRLRAINPSPFASFFKFKNTFIISSSPERLVLKKGRFCQTQPIAGTYPRKGSASEEKRHIRDFLRNEKERAEHIMLVDLERNDLGRVCEPASVKVEEMMGIEKYSHVIHLVSKISGRLERGKDALDLIRAMFPGGTITGCPKKRCMEIIEELEPVSRGLYTGSIGYVDFHGDMDLNIVIRTLLLTPRTGFFHVGAGIVYDSNPEREYEETLHKGEALAEALIQASTDGT